MKPQSHDLHHQPTPTVGAGPFIRDIRQQTATARGNDLLSTSSRLLSSSFHLHFTAICTLAVQVCAHVQKPQVGVTMFTAPNMARNDDVRPAGSKSTAILFTNASTPNLFYAINLRRMCSVSFNYHNVQPRGMSSLSDIGIGDSANNLRQYFRETNRRGRPARANITSSQRSWR